MNCVYKLCPATLYGVVQSHCSSLSHDPLHHCLSSNGSLENSERKPGHLFCYSRSCKTLQLYFLCALSHAHDKMYQALPLLSGESLGTRLTKSVNNSYIPQTERLEPEGQMLFCLGNVT